MLQLLVVDYWLLLMLLLLLLFALLVRAKKQNDATFATDKRNISSVGHWKEQNYISLATGLLWS